MTSIRHAPMPTRFLRRLRGVFGTAALWSAAGAVVGLVLAAVLEVAVLVPRHVAVEPQELFGGLALACAIAGALGGTAFAVLLATTARGRTLEGLRASRIGLLGAGAAAGVLLLAAGDVSVAAGAGVLGWAAAAGSVHAARRAIAGPSRREALKAAD